MTAAYDPLWKRVWKTEGIRWLGPRGDGQADAMERFQHGFELGMREASARLSVIRNMNRLSVLKAEVEALEAELLVQREGLL